MNGCQFDLDLEQWHKGNARQAVPPQEQEWTDGPGEVGGKAGRGRAVSLRWAGGGALGRVQAAHCLLWLLLTSVSPVLAAPEKWISLFVPSHLTLYQLEMTGSQGSVSSQDT